MKDLEQSNYSGCIDPWDVAYNQGRTRAALDFARTLDRLWNRMLAVLLLVCLGVILTIFLPGPFTLARGVALCSEFIAMLLLFKPMEGE